LPDETLTQDNNHAAEFGAVSAGYFSVLKTPLKEGRVFTDHDADSTERVVVVNEAFVRRFSAQRDAIGRRLRFVWRGKGQEAEIIGVVGNEHDDGADQKATTVAYWPIMQRDFWDQKTLTQRNLLYVVRSPRVGTPALLDDIRAHAAARPRLGYRRIHVLLRRGGWRVNHKRVYRIYRAEGLAVRRRKRKRMAVGLRTVLPPPSRPNERWSMDFTLDTLASGRRFRTLNIVDDFTRECRCVEKAHVCRLRGRCITMRKPPDAASIVARFPITTGPIRIRPASSSTRRTSASRPRVTSSPMSSRSQMAAKKAAWLGRSPNERWQ
jgi:hypothetical protein